MPWPIKAYLVYSLITMLIAASGLDGPIWWDKWVRRVAASWIVVTISICILAVIMA